MLVPVPFRPDRRYSSGRPNDPTARAPIPRGVDESHRKHQPEARPRLARVSGSLWVPMDLSRPRAFGRVVGDVGIRRQERSGDPRDPHPDRMGVPHGSRKHTRRPPSCSRSPQLPRLPRDDHDVTSNTSAWPPRIASCRNKIAIYISIIICRSGHGGPLHPRGLVMAPRSTCPFAPPF